MQKNLLVALFVFGISLTSACADSAGTRATTGRLGVTTSSLEERNSGVVREVQFSCQRKETYFRHPDDKLSHELF